jgi:hypothetical protein
MGKMTKILLTLSIAGLALGLAFASNLINAGGITAFYVLLPAGAIFFGLFLISLMLEKEVAQYDVEQRNQVAALNAQPASAEPRPAGGSNARPAVGPEHEHHLTPAHHS